MVYKFTLLKTFYAVTGIATGLAIWYSPKFVMGTHLKHPISRHIKFNKNNKSDLDITLFQYQTCPFCCKVRAYLDYNGLDYKIVEVNSVNKYQLVWSNYKKVPVVIVKENREYIQLNDSSLIISVLESYKSSGNDSVLKLTEFYPPFDTTDYKGRKKIDFYNKYHIMSTQGALKTLDEDKLETQWRQWVDEVFVHTLSPNIYRTPSEALEAFKYVSEIGEWQKTFGYLETQSLIYVGSFVMYFIGKVLKKRYNLEDDVRQSLFNQAKTWITALESRNFLGGNQANLADLAVYGVLNAIEGCSAFKELMHENVEMQSWYNRTKQSFNTAHHSDVDH